MKIKLNVIRGDLEEIHLENRKKKRRKPIIYYKSIKIILTNSIEFDFFVFDCNIITVGRFFNIFFIVCNQIIVVDC